MLTPDPASTLADGVVVETRLRARLFGASVLRIDGTVLVSPAHLEVASPPRVVRSEAVPSADRPSRTGVATRTPGAALARAAELVQESRDRLAR